MSLLNGKFVDEVCFSPAFHGKILREQSGQKSKTNRSPIKTDESLPSLDKIRFDDNIVAVIDPERSLEPRTKPRKERNAFSNVEKSFQKGRNRDEIVSPSESIVTAETFTTISGNEIVPVRGNHEKKFKNKRSGSEKKEPGQEVARDFGSENRMKSADGNNTSTRKEDLNERRLCIGGRMYSINEIESSLKKLTELKHKDLVYGAGRSRHQTNFNRIESTRTSKSASPQMKKNQLLAPQRFPETPLLPSSGPPSRDAALPTSHRADTTALKKEQTKSTPFIPRSNFNRIDSCRTSKAASPIGESKEKQRVLFGGHFMNVDEAEDLLQRLLKANKGQQSRHLSTEKMDDEMRFSSPPAYYPNENMRRRDIRRRGLATDKAEEDDSNFGHLNSLIRTEEEVTTIIVAVIICVIFFVGLCVSIKRNIH